MNSSFTINNSIDVRDCIAVALLILLKDKNIGDISITELTARAGVSRMTYYRVCESKEQVLMDYVSRIEQEFEDTLEIRGNISLREFCRSLLGFAEMHREVFSRMEHAGLLQALADHINAFLRRLFDRYLEMGDAGNDPEDVWRQQFVVGGLYVTMFRWLQTGRKEPSWELSIYMERSLKDLGISMKNNKLTPEIDV